MSISGRMDVELWKPTQAESKKKENKVKFRG
jgi:hypothetical protein